MPPTKMPPRKATSRAAVDAEEPDLAVDAEEPDLAAAASPPPPLPPRPSARETNRIPARRAPSSAPVDAGLGNVEADLGSTSVGAVKAGADAKVFLSQEERARNVVKGKDILVTTDADGVSANTKVSEPFVQKDVLVTGDAGGVSTNTKDWLKMGREFVEQFYQMLGTAPNSLHTLYHHQCDVSWKIHENSYIMKSPKDVENVMAIQTIHQGKLSFHDHVVQTNKHTVHIFVNGTYTLDKTTSNFVQSFVLRRHKISILNDALLVVLNVPQQLMHKKDPGAAAKITTNVSRIVKFKLKRPSGPAAEIAAKNSQVAAIGDKEKSDVLVVYNEECLKHVPAWDHEETPDRITNILAVLKRDGVLNRVVLQGSEQADRKHLLAAHTEELLEKAIDKLPLSDDEQEQLSLYISNEGDMYSSAGTKEAVYLAAGGVIKACHSVALGDFKKSFALVRPPGHHASANFSEGFCYVNNVAVGVRYLQKQLGLKNIMVVDIDVHHGNGSQSIFYEDESVLVFSTHCYKLPYPENTSAMGHTAIGKGKGKGFNVNVPLELNFGNADILYVLDQVLAPLVSVFKPDKIVVSAGFDAAEGDPLGFCMVTPKCYGTIAKKLVELGNGSLIMCLEGGYGDALGDCVSECVRGLLGDDDSGLSVEELRSLPLPKQDTVDTVEKVKKFLKRK